MPLTDKETEMAGRLKLFRESLNVKQLEVAKESLTSQGQLSEMESGVKQIQPRVIYYLVERYGLNVHWLYTGEGEMINLPKSETSNSNYNHADFRSVLRRLEERIENLERGK